MVHTSGTATPISCAMKPTIEKITKPENIEVEQLATLTRRESRRQLLSNLQEDTVLIAVYDSGYLL